MVLNRSLDGIFDSKTSALDLNQNYWFQGLNGSSLSFLLQSLVLQKHKNLVVIASDKEKAAYVLNDLDALLPHQKVLFFRKHTNNPIRRKKQPTLIFRSAPRC